MSVYGNNLTSKSIDNAEDITTKDLISTGTIKWEAFDPPIVGGGVAGLNQVLAVSDDAQNQSIQDLNDLGCVTVNATTSVTAPDVNVSDQIDCTGANAKINFSGASTEINGDSANKTKCTHLDITDASNIGVKQNIEQVLIEGDNAQGRDIRNVDNLTTATVEASTQLLVKDAQSQLGTTTLYGDINCEEPVTTVKHSITNALSLGSNVVDANLASLNTIVTEHVGIAGSNVANSGILDMSAGILGTAKIEFTSNSSNATQDTEIIGDSTVPIAGGGPKLTKCTYLDLSDTSNQLGPSDLRYEWGGFWVNPQTLFPPPPYADGHNVQIPPANQVHLEIDQAANNTQGWRFCAPMSDSDCQIDPDDHMELHEGEYIGSSSGYPEAFYVTTASTTIPAHSKQIIELSFNVVEYGYGRIWVGIQKRAHGTTAHPSIINESFRLIKEHDGQFIGQNTRLTGPVTMRWYLDDFPTDGSQLDLFPCFRCDDNQTTKGRFIIKISDQPPLDGCNPGTPPDFQDQIGTPNINCKGGQFGMFGRPATGNWNNFTSVQPS